MKIHDTQVMFQNMILNIFSNNNN